MYLYIILVILILGALFEVFGQKNCHHRKYQSLFFCSVIVLIYILSVIRWERGTDWDSYYYYFTTGSKTLDYFHHFENGFILLNFIVRSITDNYTILLFVLGSILYFFLYRSIKSISVYPIFSLLCYFAVMKGGIFFVRQTVAVSILLFSVKYIIDRNLKAFILLIILATLLHRSSLIFLPCYWLYNINIKLRTYIIILVGCSLIAFFLLTVANGVNIATGNPFIDAKINGYLRSGLEGEMYGVNMSKETMLIRGFGKRFIFLVLISLFLWKDMRKSPKTRGLFNIYFSGICFYLLSAPISIDFARAALPFDLMDIFLLPSIVFVQKSVSNKVILFIIISLISFNRLQSSINLRPEYFVPYKSIFNKELKVETY